MKCWRKGKKKLDAFISNVMAPIDWATRIVVSSDDGSIRYVRRGYNK